MWVATWSDYGEREPCNPGSLVLYIVSYSNRVTFVTIYLLPLPFIPFPLSLSLSLWFFAFAAIGYLSRFKRRGGREEEEEEKKVAVFKERYFAKSVETAVEEEEEEDGDRKVGRSSLPFFQLGSREEGKGCISVSVPTKFRVERYWSGRGKLGNWESPPLPTPLR